MRILVALGGNALIERGEPPTMATQRRHVQSVVAALAPLAWHHDLVITHGNGPQVGLLALLDAAHPAAKAGMTPLDVAEAESEGMIGYLLEQALAHALPGRRIAALLTQVEVDPGDPAFAAPSQSIGPLYDGPQVDALRATTPWQFVREGAHWRRVVASPRPLHILELNVIRLLMEQGVLVICAGGGIPVVDSRVGHVGVEAMIDKDHASALLARELNADLLMLLTDVDAVYADWGRPGQHPVRHGTPRRLGSLSLASGSMGPKVAAALRFVTETGRRAAIGALGSAEYLVAGRGGTQILADELHASVH